MWTVRIGMSYLLANTFGLGAFGPWVAMSMDWISRSVAFILRFLRGKWKTKRLI
jgi:Na+-driven multidrug efflux pump